MITTCERGILHGKRQLALMQLEAKFGPRSSAVREPGGVPAGCGRCSMAEEGGSQTRTRIFRHTALIQRLEGGYWAQLALSTPVKKGTPLISI